MDTPRDHNKPLYAVETDAHIALDQLGGLAEELQELAVLLASLIPGDVRELAGLDEGHRHLLAQAEADVALRERVRLRGRDGLGNARDTAPQPLAAVPHLPAPE